MAIERSLKTVFEIIECKCGQRYISTQGKDDVYVCLECGEMLTGVEPITYHVEDSKLIKFVEDNFNPSTDVPKRNF